MAKPTKEDLEVNIRVHSSDAQKQILDLETGIMDETAQFKHLQAELKATVKAEGANSAAAKEKRIQTDVLTASIDGNKAALSCHLSTLNVSQMTIKELTKRSKELSTALRTAIPGTKEWKAYSKELADVNGRLKQLKSGQSATGGVITKIGLLGSGIAAAVGAVQGVITKAYSWRPRPSEPSPTSSRPMPTSPPYSARAPWR